MRIEHRFSRSDKGRVTLVGTLLALALVVGLLAGSSVTGGGPQRALAGKPVTITVGSAGGSYNKTFSWDITKEVDIDQGVATADLGYTVTVSNDTGTVSDVLVSGSLNVDNPTSAALVLTSITASAGGVSCTVDTSGGLTVPATGNKDYSYECDLGDTLPAAGAKVEATAVWSGGSDSDEKSIPALTQNKIDECVSVADPEDSSSPRTFCVGDPHDPDFSFTYSQTVDVPESGCQTYDNTATFTTNDTGTTGSDAASAEVCAGAAPLTTKAIGLDTPINPTCNATEWKFEIDKLDSCTDAPATIDVSFTGDVDSPHTVTLLSCVAGSGGSGSTATYTTDLHLDGTVSSASADIYTDWGNGGKFQLTEGPSACEKPETVNWDKNGATGGYCNSFENDEKLTPELGQQGWLFVLTSPYDDGPWELTTTFDPASQQPSNPVSGEQQGQNGAIHFIVYTDEGAQLLSASATNGTEHSVLTVSHCEVGWEPPTVTKTAEGSYDDTYTWTIAKALDVDRNDNTADLNYTVTVRHGASVVSNVKVTGTITVNNPNSVDFELGSITDELDGTDCDVTGDLTLSPGNNDFDYECDLGNDLPSGDVFNTVTIEWPKQTLANHALVTTGTDDFTSPAIDFAVNEIDECVDVRDSVEGFLGTVCVGNANPRIFDYTNTVDIPAGDCDTFDNTARFVTNDTGATGSDSETVRLCGETRTTPTPTPTPPPVLFVAPTPFTQVSPAEVVKEPSALPKSGYWNGQDNFPTGPFTIALLSSLAGLAVAIGGFSMLRRRRAEKR